MTEELEQAALFEPVPARSPARRDFIVGMLHTWKWPEQPKLKADQEKALRLLADDLLAGLNRLP